MKNPKRPTRKQKLAIAAAKLDPDNWLVAKVEKYTLVLINKNSNKERTISA
jgi:hypothetical protein